MEIWTSLQMTVRDRMGMLDDIDLWEDEMVTWASWTCHLDCGHPYVFQTGDDERTLVGQDRYCNTCGSTQSVYRMERKSR